MQLSFQGDFHAMQAKTGAAGSSVKHPKPTKKNLEQETIQNLWQEPRHPHQEKVLHRLSSANASMTKTSLFQRLGAQVKNSLTCFAKPVRS